LSDENRLVRKLDAGKLPVQFDERGVETEPCRLDDATAPHLDSTLRPAAWVVRGRLLIAMGVYVDLAVTRMASDSSPQSPLEAELTARVCNFSITPGNRLKDHYLTTSQ